MGNVWFSNFYGNNLVEISNLGALLSPAAGYTATNLYHPQRVAIDLLGNVWVPGGAQTDPDTFATIAPATLAKFSSAGVLLSGTGFTGGGYSGAFGIMVDGANNVWAGQSSKLAEFSNAGVALSPSTGYASTSIAGLVSVALDSAGNVRATAASVSSVNGTTNAKGTLAEFSSTGNLLSPAAAYTGGGNFYPQSLAVDGSNNLWAASFTVVQTLQRAVVQPSSIAAVWRFRLLPATPRELRLTGSSSMGLGTSGNPMVARLRDISAP